MKRRLNALRHLDPPFRSMKKPLRVCSNTTFLFGNWNLAAQNNDEAHQLMSTQRTLMDMAQECINKTISSWLPTTVTVFPTQQSPVHGDMTRQKVSLQMCGVVEYEHSNARIIRTADTMRYVQDFYQFHDPHVDFFIQLKQVHMVNGYLVREPDLLVPGLCDDHAIITISQLRQKLAEFLMPWVWSGPKALGGQKP